MRMLWKFCVFVEEVDRLQQSLKERGTKPFKDIKTPQLAQIKAAVIYIWGQSSSRVEPKYFTIKDGLGCDDHLIWTDWSE